MGDFLILAVVIAVVCIAVDQDQKKKKKGKCAQKTGYHNSLNADTYSKRIQGHRTGSSHPANVAGWQDMRRSDGQGDILSRANLNVRDNENDHLREDMRQNHEETILRDMHSMSESVNPMEQHSLSEPHPFGGFEESSELMRQVTDLMIMGYQPQLSGERDFVAEGIDMLQNFDGIV